MSQNLPIAKVGIFRETKKIKIKNLKTKKFRDGVAARLMSGVGGGVLAGVHTRICVQCGRIARVWPQF